MPRGPEGERGNNFSQEKEKQIEARKNFVDSLADKRSMIWSEDDPNYESRLFAERKALEKEIERHITDIRAEISGDIGMTSFDDREKYKQNARERAKEKTEELSVGINKISELATDKDIEKISRRKWSGELFTILNKMHREKDILDAIANGKITPDIMEDESGLGSR